jgi:Tfp pilus assembly protein PilO
MRFWQRRQLTVPAVGLLVMVAFWFVRHVPLQKTKSELKQAMLAQERVMAAAKVQAAQLPQLRQQVEHLRSEVGDFEAKVPVGKPVYGDFLEQIAELMSRCRLQEQSVQPQQEVCGEQIHCIPIYIQGKARLGDIFEFFRALERLDRKIRIVRLELNNDRQFSGLLSMQAEVGIYYVPDAQNLM